MVIFLKALTGAVIVVVIQLLAKTKHTYVAGLVPLFPTFTLISHYVVGTERTTEALKETIVFGLFSLVPYAAYLVTLYYLVDRCTLGVALVGATFFWGVAATVLIVIWNWV